MRKKKIKKQILKKKYHFFDLENSKVPTKERGKVPVVYLSNLLTWDIIRNREVNSMFFRDIKEFIDYLEVLNSNGYDNYIYIHNLQFEFSHIKPNIDDKHKLLIYSENDKGREVSESIFRGTTDPIRIRFEGLENITFVDSLALTNKSVKSMGEDLNIPKLEYDYEVLRLPTDELTEIDYLYNKRDNEIVANYISKGVRNREYQWDDIPLTFTGNVKRHKNEFIKKFYPKKKDQKHDALYKLKIDKINSLHTREFTELCIKSFRGGLTGCNANLVNKMIPNVYSIDIKSSYPFQMCSKFFPKYLSGKVEHYVGENANIVFNNLLTIGLENTKYKGYIGTFKFKEIRVKYDDIINPLSYVSGNSDYSRQPGDYIRYNGKFHYAKEFTLSFNNIDFIIYNLCYTWDEIECIDLYLTDKSYYSDERETSYLLYCFNAKENVKDKGSQEYVLAKQGLNGMYGVKVQKPVVSTFIDSEEGIKEIGYLDLEEEERIKRYNLIEDEWTRNAEKNYNIYTDGCYTTSYARLMLINMQLNLRKLGCEIVYTDTDSVKFTSPDISTTIKFIKENNKKIMYGNDNNKNFIAFRKKFNPSLCEYVKLRRLGIWEIENKPKVVEVNGEYKKLYDEEENLIYEPIKYFKTLGAKKYSYIDIKYDDNGKPFEEIKTVIAGCSRALGKHITSYAKNNNLNLVNTLNNIFRPGIIFSSEISGRTVLTRFNKQDLDCILTLDTKKTSKDPQQVFTSGGSIIENTTYTLNISKEDQLTYYKFKDFIDVFLFNENSENTFPIFNGKEIIYP